MIKEIVTGIKESVRALGFDVAVGDIDLSKPRKYPFVQIIPDSGQRTKYVGGAAVITLEITLIVIRRGLENQIEESELLNLDDIESILSVFKNNTLMINNKTVRISATNFQLDRMREQEMNFYFVGSAIILSAEFSL